MASESRTVPFAGPHPSALVPSPKSASAAHQPVHASASAPSSAKPSTAEGDPAAAEHVRHLPPLVVAVIAILAIVWVVRRGRLVIGDARKVASDAVARGALADTAGNLFATAGLVTLLYYWANAGLGESFAIGIALWTLAVTARQLTIASRQTTILEAQDSEAHRKARLVVWGEGSIRATVTAEPVVSLPLSLMVANIGERSQRECIVHVFLPMGWGSAQYEDYKANSLGDDWVFRGADIIQGTVYKRYDRTFNQLLIPGCPVKIALLDLRAYSTSPTESGRVLYRVVYEDGGTPSYDGTLPLVNRREIDLPDLPDWIRAEDFSR